MEFTNHTETPGCSNFDFRDINMGQNQYPNKNDLILTINNKAKLDNSKVGDGKQILNTPENTSEENPTKTQENSNRTITSNRTLHRKCTDVGNQFRKTPVVIKKYTSQTDFKREIVTQQSKS